MSLLEVNNQIVRYGQLALMDNEKKDFDLTQLARTEILNTNRKSMLHRKMQRVVSKTTDSLLTCTNNSKTRILIVSGTVFFSLPDILNTKLAKIVSLQMQKPGKLLNAYMYDNYSQFVYIEDNKRLIS